MVNRDNKPPLLVILGQTAVGKTALSLTIGQLFHGEIISADSRLFYRGMNIGTAKPLAKERAAVPHHLIDICDPDEVVTLGAYQRLAFSKINEVQANSRLPILVGGTGQYIKAVVEGWGIPEVPPNESLRQILAEMGGETLAKWLQTLDPTAAQRIDPRNVRRIIRALEVTLLKGVPISTLQLKNPPPYQICQIGLTRNRENLYARIDNRVDQMMAAGLLQEIKALAGAGYGRSLPSMSGLGYRQLWAYLDGEMSLEEAVERIKFETHRFSRQQNNWFRLDDPTIHWFDLEEEGVETAVINFVADWLSSQKPVR